MRRRAGRLLGRTPDSPQDASALALWTVGCTDVAPGSPFLLFPCSRKSDLPVGSGGPLTGDLTALGDIFWSS